MELVVHDPSDGIYATDDYIHALEVNGASRLLYVAGTMGLDVNGSPADTVEQQLDLIWSNISRILESAGMSVDNIVRLTSYLTDPKFADANAEARLRALNGRRIPTTAIIAQTLVPEWLVEIEVVAAQ